MYPIGILCLKKPHACVIKSTGKKANKWEVIRLGNGYQNPFSEL